MQQSLKAVATLRLVIDHQNSPVFHGQLAPLGFARSNIAFSPRLDQL
jgi:hypothetical protein